MSYSLYPKEDGDIYETEVWSAKLFNGRELILHITTGYSECDICVEFDDDDDSSQKLDDLMKKTYITLNDYSAHIRSLSMPHYYDIKLVDEEHFSEEEIREINKLIYDDDEHDFRLRDVIDTFDMEDRWWILDDTVYEIMGKCILEKN